MNRNEVPLESLHLEDIILGRKTVEAWLNEGACTHYEVGDIIRLRQYESGVQSVSLDDAPKTLLVQIVAIRPYATFSEMLRAERYQAVSPTANNIEEAIAEYDRRYSVEKQALHGVLAMELRPYHDWDKAYASGGDYSHLVDRVVEDMVQQVPAPVSGSRRALDIGCGVGNLARQLAGAGCEVTGVDPSPEAIKRAKAQEDGNTYIVGDIKAAPRMQYDVITCKHVFRFVSQKAQFLEEVRELMSDTGVFVLITPTLDRVVHGKPGIAVDRNELYAQLDKVFLRFKEYELPTGLLVMCKKK